MRKSLVIVILSMISVGLTFGQADSLGIEKRGDKVFVVHKVKAKQTLYSLARRYKTSVTEINNANPALANGLQVGQTLKIPFGGVLPQAERPEVTTITETITHKVQAGETLFAIARKYEVSITDLKIWNKMNSNSLALGQELKVQLQKEVETQEVTPLPDNTVADTVTTTPAVVLDTVSNEQTMADALTVEEEPEPIAYDGTPFKSYEVQGLAEVIEEEEPSSKFFALHRTAKVGTVIKVKNLMNDLTVYVRVVGTIPDTSDNENIIIKLNKRAYDHLKAIDKRFRVQLNYFQ